MCVVFPAQGVVRLKEIALDKYVVCVRRLKLYTGKLAFFNIEVNV